MIKLKYKVVIVTDTVVHTKYFEFYKVAWQFFLNAIEISQNKRVMFFTTSTKGNEWFCTQDTGFMDSTSLDIDIKEFAL